MNQPLRVLLVEDSEDDAELLRLELRRGGCQAQFHRVQTAAALSAALDQKEWDIIISDYVMPGFNGLEALKVFKEKGIDLPFILVSGHMGEEIAVHAMKSGAHDYIMKDKMARLIPAIQRELREAAVRRARKDSQRALRESDERFRQLAQNIDVAFFMFDLFGDNGTKHLVYVSPAYQTIWGHPCETLYQDECSWFKAIHPEDQVAVIERLPAMEKGEFQLEFRITTPGGKTRWIDYRTFPVFNDSGEIYRVAALAEDITERKEAQEQLSANAQQLAHMVQDLQVIDQELRSSNGALQESRRELEKRVTERTSALTVANAELQCQIHERIRLERELLEIAEKERRRIGFELHDDLSQKLMGASFMIKALERKISSKHLAGLPETRQIQELINQVLNHTRDLSHEFSTLETKGNDLAEELKELAANVKKMFRVSCNFARTGALPPLPQNIAVQLYKIAQEAASNAVKHGRSKLISISLAAQPGKLVLTIKNDGVPFENKKSGDGIGLRIMNSRASIVGASLDIRPQSGNGTAVTCTLPFSNVSKVTHVDFISPQTKLATPLEPSQQSAYATVLQN